MKNPIKNKLLECKEMIKDGDVEITEGKFSWDRKRNKRKLTPNEKKLLISFIDDVLGGDKE